MTLDTYGHVLDELEGSDRVSVETEIRRAREEDRVRFVSEAAEQAAESTEETALQSQAQYRTRTDDPFLTMEVLYQLS
jgi:hypothetical protein